MRTVAFIHPRELTESIPVSDTLLGEPGTVPVQEAASSQVRVRAMPEEWSQAPTMCGSSPSSVPYLVNPLKMSSLCTLSRRSLYFNLKCHVEAESIKQMKWGPMGREDRLCCVFGPQGSPQKPKNSDWWQGPFSFIHDFEVVQHQQVHLGLPKEIFLFYFQNKLLL
jgi:hypothetical protein